MPYPRIDPFYFSPLKIFEAMSMGLPVLASAQVQISELIEDGKSGCLYPPGHQKVFLEKLEALLDSPELRSSLGRRARETMEKKYTWRQNASRVLALCQSIAGST
ncbi:MAG: glycosyltransferase family 4 protein [Pseudomonadota bacterium]